MIAGEFQTGVHLVKSQPGLVDRVARFPSIGRVGLQSQASLVDVVGGAVEKRGDDGIAL